MSTVTTDLLSGQLLAEEYEGALRTLQTTVRVSGLTSTDHSILFEALEAAGVPAVGSSPDDHPNLVLVRRTPRLVDGDNRTVDIDLEYVAKADSQRDFVFSGSWSLKSYQTQKTPIGAPLAVSYTYPADYQLNSELQGQTVTQGVDLNVNIPVFELSATGIIAVDYPHYEARSWVMHLNSTPWAGGQIGRWLCTNVEFKLHNADLDPHEYMFTFSFQYDPMGWQPEYVFIDPNTGRPPADVIYNIGRKRLLWYPYRDYNRQFTIDV